MYNKKTLLLTFALIIFIALIFTISSLRKMDSSKPPSFLPLTTQAPKKDLPATNFPPVTLNPRVFRVLVGKSKCEPSQITVETEDKVRIAFEPIGGFEESQIKGILAQENVLRTTSSEEIVYEFKAVKPVELQYFCKEFDEDPDKFGQLVIKTPV